MNRKNEIGSIYWDRLQKVRKVTGDVTMTPDQFRKQLEQAAKFGYVHGKSDGQNKPKSRSDIIEDRVDGFLDSIFRKL
jgi:hypothetical protein